MKILTDDWKYKIVALILAVMLWWTVQGDVNPKANQKFVVPVEVRNLVADKSVELEVIQATVTVNDKRIVTDNLTENDIKAYVDVSEIMQKEKELENNPFLYKKSSHTYTVPINFEIHSRYTIRVKYTPSPKETKIKVKQTSSKSMLVNLEYDSMPSVGHVYKISDMPVKSVAVIGIDSELAKVEKIIGHISNVSEKGYKGYVDLTAYDAGGKEIRSVKIEPGSVECSVSIVPENLEKSLMVIPEFSGKLPANYILKEILCEPNTVMAGGNGTDFIKKLTVSTYPINLSEIKNSCEKEAKLNLNGIKCDRDTVKVKIKLEKIK